MSRWMHFSDADVIEPHSVRQDLFGSMKPDGLWISDEDDHGWTAWADPEGWAVGSNRFDVELAADANLLLLGDTDAILSFTRRYMTCGRSGGPVEPWYIDWARVAQLYKGILITPYDWHCRMSLDTQWYYGWDCASGCIWDASAIASVTPAREQVAS